MQKDGCDDGPRVMCGESWREGEVHPNACPLLEEVDDDGCSYEDDGPFRLVFCPHGNADPDECG